MKWNREIYTGLNNSVHDLRLRCEIDAGDWVIWVMEDGIEKATLAFGEEVDEATAIEKCAQICMAMEKMFDNIRE